MPHDWDDVYGPPWGRISTRIVEQPAARLRGLQSIMELDQINRNERIFTSETEAARNPFFFLPNGMPAPLSPDSACWREKEDGTREQVTYRFGWGWVSEADMEKWSELIERFSVSKP